MTNKNKKEMWWFMQKINSGKILFPINKAVDIFYL